MKKLLAIAAVTFVATGCASSTRPGAVGVTRQQTLWVSSEKVDKIAADSYLQMAVQAKMQGKLITQGPEYDRLKAIAMRVKAQANTFRDDADAWHWQFALINDPKINAACAPGGKIILYTGLPRTLHLTDDEVAVVLGHEVAHALREHGREKLSQAMLKNTAVQIASVAAPGAAGTVGLANQASQLLFTLPNSRQNEVEADQMGLELAARAGFDPRAAITLWQKMATASQGKAPPEFLSTHPSDASRIESLSALMPTVMPLYEAAHRR
ncbi:M48 family metallopeptidase [Noviherbaspirillum pedocola]|uniref:M48 family metallopeptidase n=1 Tax=Noviherbaspirillum pedocola TaxID=2801341 RepID=A0A934W6F6_9BURK|nr:M48 family metallopeptidase [Noviherbaspirillum pedocola]MBK4736167.1 M48 family metallopeptidase [Noviherbaspirillum pedocola]